MGRSQSYTHAFRPSEQSPTTHDPIPRHFQPKRTMSTSSLSAQVSEANQACDELDDALAFLQDALEGVKQDVRRFRESMRDVELHGAASGQGQDQAADPEELQALRKLIRQMAADMVHTKYWTRWFAGELDMRRIATRRAQMGMDGA